MKDNTLEQMVLSNMNEIRSIRKELPRAVEAAVDKHVNGKINRLHDKVDNLVDSQKKKHEEQDKILGDIYEAMYFLRGLNKFLKSTAGIASSVMIIVGAFWMFVKFVANNLKF